MEFFDKVRKVLRFLAECLSPWSAEDGMIPYSVTKRLITMTVMEETVRKRVTTIKVLYMIKDVKNAAD